MKEDILKILESYNTNGKLSDSELEALNKIATNDPQLFEDYSGDMEQLLNDPAMKERTAKLMKQGKIESGVAAGLNVFMGIRDYSTGKKQERLGREALSKVTPPSTPRLSLKNPILNQQINNALRGDHGVEQALSPAKQEILDNYYNDIANAKTASAGQASTFGSLAQVASQRRTRGAASLSPIAAQIMARNNERLDGLLGQQQADKVSQFDADRSLYNTDLRQYNDYVNAAGQLAQTGQINQRNSLNSIFSTLPQLAGQFGTMSRRQPQVSGFGSEIDAYANDTQDSLLGRYGSRDSMRSPYYFN